MQVARSDELHQQATKYCAQLQEYNGRLQSDAQGAAERLTTLQVGAIIQQLPFTDSWAEALSPKPPRLYSAHVPVSAQPSGDDTPLTARAAMQEERTAGMEEAARLKGTLAALETQLAAAQSAAQAAEGACQRSSADAAALQAELQQVGTPLYSLAMPWAAT